MKSFNQEQVLDLLLALQTVINPQQFETTKGLDPEDFCDLATCKATELGLLQEFNDACKTLKSIDIPHQGI